MSDKVFYEFDRILDERVGEAANAVPSRVFEWLETQCLREDVADSRWLRLSRVGNRRAIGVSGFVGVLRAPCGYQIEILPKIGKDSSEEHARAILIDMIKCLAGFKHIKVGKADLMPVKMPLLDVFIGEFLRTVADLARRGLRSDYVVHQDNLGTLRGRLLLAEHLNKNLMRPERFYTEHDEFVKDRAENRLLHSALRRILAWSRSHEHQRLARELRGVFAGIPLSSNVALDLQRIRLARGMSYYKPALDWAKIILQGLSPTASSGTLDSVAIMFSMEALFEAYVATSLSRQLQDGHAVKVQARTQHLVAHKEEQWFRLKPDLMITQGRKTRAVLDTKWKRLDAAKSGKRDKYQLSQSDFYQLYAYGHHYLDGPGDLVLIYPKTDRFHAPLSGFAFPRSDGLKLWVLPFCLRQRRLLLPESGELHGMLIPAESRDAPGTGQVNESLQR